MVSSKTVVLLGGLLARGSLANLSIGAPSIDCTASPSLCLRGMSCVEDESTSTRWCKFPKFNQLYRGVEAPKPIPAPSEFSTDGKCGTQNGGLLCNPSSTVYSGRCCSQSGWCGNTAGHCGTGCQSNCGGKDKRGTAESPMKAPVPPVSISVSSAATGPPTKDGSCGRTKGDATCAGWSLGECCSMYGFCGNTAGHCGSGCQSGPCKGGLPAAPGPAPAPITNGGSFTVIGKSGVPAMHAALTQNGRVIFLDKVEDYTELKFPNGKYAYSSEYNPADNKVVPLSLKTNAFCAGGVFLANGDLVSIGGNGPLEWLDPSVTDGFNAIRYLSRSGANATLNGQDWREPGNKLASNRWYPSVQILSNGKIFVASGSLNGLDPTNPANNNPTYEILSPSGISEGKNIPLDILVKNQPYYMYPFTHLLRNGQIFIFTSKSSQIFDIDGNKIVKELPDLPGDYRTYPNTGGSVLLPLSSANGWASKVMICGGGAYQDVTSPTDPSCGVIAPEDSKPTWEMDSMPQGRGMVEGVNLPDGTVLWLNGANRGAEGFDLALDPTLAALLYDYSKPAGQRFTQLAASDIPRLYHSVALLLLDGTVMVAGSNPHEMPIQDAKGKTPFVTEFRVERFTPPYLTGNNANRRPTNLVIPNKTLPGDGSLFGLSFDVPAGAKTLQISLVHGGFVTHAVHMNQRMMTLERRNWKPNQKSQKITARMPPNKNVAPPGPYVLYVLVDGVPSVGQFIQVV